MKKNPSKSTLDNRANQLNPICVQYYRSRGFDLRKAKQRAIAARKSFVRHSELKHPITIR